MAQGGDTPPGWDSEWVYTDGLPTVKGWVKATTGGTEAIVSNGLQLRANYYNFSNEPVHKGVIEAKLCIENTKSSLNVTRAHLRIGDSTNSVYVIFRSQNSSHKIRLYNNSSPQSGTAIGSFSLGQWYIVTIRIDGANGEVDINGETVATNIDTTGMIYLGAPQFGSGGSEYAGAIWEYVKFRKES